MINFEMNKLLPSGFILQCCGDVALFNPLTLKVSLQVNKNVTKGSVTV